MIALEPDVVGLVRDVTHGVSDTASKLTGTVSHVLGRATGDSSYQEEREQNLENAQSSGDHFKTGLINLTGGIFGGVTSIFTQPYEGAIEDGLGVTNLLISHSHLMKFKVFSSLFYRGFSWALGKEWSVQWLNQLLVCLTLLQGQVPLLGNH